MVSHSKVELSWDRGGKVAMTVALQSSLPAATLSKLIVVDIAPARGKLSKEFKEYISAMKKIEAAKVSSRQEALGILQEFEKVSLKFYFSVENLIVVCLGPGYLWFSAHQPNPTAGCVPLPDTCRSY